MEKEDHKSMVNKLKQITREGATKSNPFWKTRRKIMAKPNEEEYDTITDENNYKQKLRRTIPSK